MRSWATGVAIISAKTIEGRHGMTVNSFTSVSLDPPLVAFLPAKSSTSWPAIKKAGAFCVNVMAEDQLEVTGVFASKAEDKFAGVEWEPCEATGSPRIIGCTAWMDCTIEQIHEAGDHWIVIGRVEEMDVESRDAIGPLLFFAGGYGKFTS